MHEDGCQKTLNKSIREKVFLDFYSPISNLSFASSEAEVTICIDFRKLNELNVKEIYPLPVVDSISANIKAEEPKPSDESITRNLRLQTGKN